VGGAKPAANVTRDPDTHDRLISIGWTVIRIWEHEDPVSAAGRIETALGAAAGLAP